jgi:hypothetical protein
MNATIVLAALASGLYVCNVKNQQQINIDNNKAFHRQDPTEMIPLIMEDSNFHFTPAMFCLALLLSTSDYFKSAPFYLILYLAFINLVARIPPLNY